MDTKETGLRIAIDFAGGIKAFAKAIGVSAPLVRDWLENEGTTVKARTYPDSAVLKAVEVAGSRNKLAAALGVTRMSVYIWLCQGYVPPARAKEIEMQFGIPRGDLVSAKVRSNLGLGGEL